MSTQAEDAYPEECCGLLLGTLDSVEDCRRVRALWPLKNHWTPETIPSLEGVSSTAVPSKRNRYWADPKDLMTAQRYSRDRDWVVLGVYHSHPDHPAVPSERDRQMAWTEYSYPILSVADGRVTGIRSWRLDEAGGFQPEAIDFSTHFEGLWETSHTAEPKRLGQYPARCYLWFSKGL